MKSNFELRREDASERPAVSVQILSIIFYAGFAIPVSIVAMVQFGLIGFALPVFFAWQWGRMPTLNGGMAVREAVEQVRPVVTGEEPKTSGNRSFDAYKAALMTRLEEEQTNFETFLDRLRASKDHAEFDQFMDARAIRARVVSEPEQAKAATNAQAVGTPLPA